MHFCTMTLGFVKAVRIKYIKMFFSAGVCKFFFKNNMRNSSMSTSEKELLQMCTF